MANSRWIICRPKRGSHVIQDRASNEVIGSIRPYRKPGASVQYLATRPDGAARDFFYMWDAAYWLMAGFDAQQEGR